MTEPADSQEALDRRMTAALNFQGSSHQALMRSPAMRVHAATVVQTAAAIESLISGGAFETLLDAEATFQKTELEKFSGDPEMRESIRKTQKDLAAGIKDYRQLLEDPGAYLARGYRDSDKTGPNKEYPVDTMRKVLRSQATRIGNFAKNPLLSVEEKKLHRLRVSMLRRCEKLYERIQRRALESVGSD